MRAAACYCSLMLPWEYPVPPVLYKYRSPERLDMLTSGKVRFSHRLDFPDDHELKPGYERFGDHSEILRYSLSEGLQLARNGLSALEMAVAMEADPRAQRLAIENMQRNTKSIDEVGILCLTEDAGSDQMWEEYGGKGAGFVVGFDTAHAGFDRLKTPGRLGKVSYSDERIGSALGSLFNDEAIGALFRKRMKYAFEREWRTVRLLRRLDERSERAGFSFFDPASVREIVIRPSCVVESELRQLIASDELYRRVSLVVKDSK